MKKILLIFFISLTSYAWAQDSLTQATTTNPLKISGELITDQRFLFEKPNNWVWNENRLQLEFRKKASGLSSFTSEIWLRNLGFSNPVVPVELSDKNKFSPLLLEFRELSLEMLGFPIQQMDIKIGRQPINWGTADKFNPTNNLNPLDFEDVFDFGRRRPSDAINLKYYFNSDHHLQAVYIPYFQPANLPFGVFSGILMQEPSLPQGLTLKEFSPAIQMPQLNLKQNATAALRYKGILKGVDYSVSYTWGFNGFPINTYNKLSPVDTLGGISLATQLNYFRTHIIGADMATDIAGVGIWGEVAAFLPDEKVHQINDLSALYPLSPIPVINDSVLIDDKNPYLKWVVGADYHFRNNIYMNVQFLHGFFHEAGKEQLNDYLFARLEKNCCNDKLKLAPISGAFIINDWDKLKNHYAFAWMPSCSWTSPGDFEISLAAAVLDGKGEGLFTNLKNMDMMWLKIKYSF